jgi:VCBS repeat-containing protein
MHITTSFVTNKYGDYRMGNSGQWLYRVSMTMEIQQAHHKRG